MGCKSYLLRVLPIFIGNAREEARFCYVFELRVRLHHIDAHCADILGILVAVHSVADERPLIKIGSCSVFDNDLVVDYLIYSLAGSLSINRTVEL